MLPSWATARRTQSSDDPNLLPTGTSLELDHQLLSAMYVTIELIGMLRRLHCESRHSRQIRAEIKTVAWWITFLTKQREQIDIETADQKPDLVKLGARIVCQECRTGGNHDRGRSNSYEDPPPPPIWEMQLDFLLASTKRIAVELFEQDCASSNLTKYPECLEKLMNALLRLRRCLAFRGAGETNIKVEHCFDNCARCGRPVDPPVTVP